MLLSSRETKSSPHLHSILGARASASLRLFLVDCTPSLTPLFVIKHKEKTKFFSSPISFFGQILRGGKICPSILSWYQKFAANYFGFGIILNVREGYPKFTIKRRKQYQKQI